MRLCPIAIYKELLHRRPVNAPDKLYLACGSTGSRKAGTFLRGSGWKAGPHGVNEVKFYMHAICLAAGITDRTNHALRATGISDMYAAGIPEGEIQERSRHRSLEGLRMYNQ